MTITLSSRIIALCATFTILLSCGGEDQGLFVGADSVSTPTPLSSPTVTVTSTPAASPTASPDNTASPTPTADPTSVVDGIAIRGSISGLSSGQSLTLQELSSGQILLVSATGTFNFADPFSDGSGYEVTVSVQPDSQNCTVSNSTGTISGADVTDITITCLGDAGYSVKLTGFEVADPSFVIGGVRVVDITSGHPVTNLSTSDFNVTENDQAIGIESYLDAEQIVPEDVDVRTVLLLDISTSIDSDEMTNIKSAAKAALYDEDEEGEKTSRLFTDRQQVSIYTFDSEVSLLIDFTTDLDALEAAIDSIPNSVLERANSTNLLGAVEIGAEQWDVSISLASVEYGYAILLTDGVHNYDGRLPEDIEVSLLNEYDIRKAIYAIAVGDGVSTENLTTLTGTSDRVYEVTSFDDPQVLVDVFTQISEEAQQQTQGLYRVYYATPKRIGEHNVTFALVNNNGTCTNVDNCSLSAESSFLADDFSDVEAVLFGLISGGTEEESGQRISSSDILVVEADLRWANITPSYSIVLSDLVGVSPTVTELSSGRWAYQFAAGFDSATLVISESVTGYTANVTLTNSNSGVLAVSDSTLEDYISSGVVE